MSGRQVADLVEEAREERFQSGQIGSGYACVELDPERIST